MFWNILINFQLNNHLFNWAQGAVSLTIKASASYVIRFSMTFGVINHYQWGHSSFSSKCFIRVLSSLQSLSDYKAAMHVGIVKNFRGGLFYSLLSSFVVIVIIILVKEVGQWHRSQHPLCSAGIQCYLNLLTSES